jgi:hypothetical protein
VTGDMPASHGIDSSVATAARMYDYFLGGHENFAVDRIAALKIIQAAHEIPELARENRKFLGRAVRFLVGEAGISQFLDLGTGLPTRGNVHQVAQQLNPAARVIYVDNDPMVYAHSRALKTGDGTAVIQADMRDTDKILGHPDLRRLTDPSEPLAVMFISVLHFISDADAPHEIVRKYLGAFAPGSYLALSHATTDPSPRTAETVASVYAATTNPATARTRAEILQFFDGLELVGPGLVPISQWRPEAPAQENPLRQWMLGGVGRSLFER